MTLQLTVHVTLICSCVGLGKTTRAVTLKAAGAAQQEIVIILCIIEKQTSKLNKVH